VDLLRKDKAKVKDEIVSNDDDDQLMNFATKAFD